MNRFGDEYSGGSYGDRGYGTEGMDGGGCGDGGGGGRGKGERLRALEMRIRELKGAGLPRETNTPGSWGRERELWWGRPGPPTSRPIPGRRSGR